MIHAKKSLGQHFLRSKDALKKIILSGEITPDELVLEIGPGEGVLTQELLTAGARVIAVETDARCITLLTKKFAEEIKNGKLQLIVGDIRNEPTQKKLFQKKYLGTSKYKLIANIPYYITGMLFRLFLEQLRQPTLLVFLVQKEVAEQILGRDGKESILSLAVKVYGEPKFIGKVKREAFSPPPKVDSAIIAVRDISRKRLGKLSDENYFRVVKAGLGAKRKMLLGNLSRVLKIEKGEIADIFQKLNIPETIRGEDLDASTWILLARALMQK